MSRVTLYLERSIDSSHVLPEHPGKCGRLHGHTYRFQVWVTGPVEPASGMVVDLLDVKACIDEWDHRHLNDLVEFTPTAELLAVEMRRRIRDLVLRHARSAGNEVDPQDVSVRVRLWETQSGYAEAGASADVDALSADQAARGVERQPAAGPA